MATGTQVKSGDEVRQWWRRTKARNQIFFHLMDDKAPTTKRLQNIQGFIQQLEISYGQLESETYPRKAEAIRTHLLNAIEHLAESLIKLDNREHFQSDVSFDVAKVDFSMVQHELLSQGIID